MAKKDTFHEQLKQFKDYIFSESNEDAKRPLLYPLFNKLNKEKFKIESDACGADVYIEGQIIVESKTAFQDWLSGFYQALHYQKRYGLAYTLIMVVAHKFVGIWKVNKIPEEAVYIAHTSNSSFAPSIVGKENAQRTKTKKSLKQEIQDSAIFWLEPRFLEQEYFSATNKGILHWLFEMLNILKNPTAERLQMNTRNFIQHIELLKKFFDRPIDAVHCFYTIVAYWDITSVVSTTDYSDNIQLSGFKGKKHSEDVAVKPHHHREFKKFIESRYIFTNEGSGLTVDYYFSRFDEVMAVIDPEYVAQHGIFFTDINLSKFALWFAKNKLKEELDEQYIWFDPAGGSGNLISSWRGKLKHKIISELQPDLLRIIERRMKIDPWHIETGFTIIPKTSENKGLNFLDCNAQEYLSELNKELKTKNLPINKPFAFLLNPPYKNTDENKSKRVKTDSEYGIDKTILEITGGDAGKERYLAFLGQILNISKLQSILNEEFEPIVLIFTPTSWLIPRPTYENFREIWDNYFEFVDGFLITSNEFFKLKGKWPLAFTIWRFWESKNRRNKVKVFDYTNLSRNDLMLNWNLSEEDLKFHIGDIFQNSNLIRLDNSRGDIRKSLSLIDNNSGRLIRQTRYDFSTAKKDHEKDKLVSGFPLKDKDRHFKLKRKCGNVNGEFVGFMDDLTPVRILQDSLNRMSTKPNSVWFRLDNDFKGVNKTKTFNGPPDNRGYCAYDLESSKILFSWFSITKILNGKYPLWANQYDIWSPSIKDEYSLYWNALCFSFVLSENRCILTKFEANNPVEGTPEIFVENPLCPTNSEAFWATTLDTHVTAQHGVAFELVNKIKKLYRYWNKNYCQGDFLTNVGLHNEPYFKYFNYPDFVTPHSGMIQIRKYAEINGCTDLMDMFSEIQLLTKDVKNEIYRLLIKEFEYFS